MEALTSAKADLTVYVHPSKSNKVADAVRKQLTSLLFTYDELFDGVLLAHKISFPSKHAKILPGLIPYFGVKVRAKLLIFSPKPNMLLDGKVVKLSKESIHVIVLGFSSAAIMLEDIRGEFKYKIKHGAECFVSSSHKRHRIKVGSMIRFAVKSVDEEIVHISGSLIPPQTGCIRWLSKHSADAVSQTDRSLKRNRDRDSELFDNGDQSQNFSRLPKLRKGTKYPYVSATQTALKRPFSPLRASRKRATERCDAVKNWVEHSMRVLELYWLYSLNNAAVNNQI